ncbi:RNA-binding S4 domain-containing protein [Bacteroidota bacterium]
MVNRIDKYLWSVRIYKTRALAAEACKKGRVMMNEMSVKPSRSIKAGEVIMVRKVPVLHSYIVLDPIQKRVGAKLVAEYMQDITPQEELDKLTMQDDFYIKRERGTGRPTKKERRTLDKLKE